jgi:hypothetical protein
MKQNRPATNEVLAKDHRIRALAMLANPEDIPLAIQAGEWAELTALKDFISDGLPVAPGSDVTADFKRLLKQTAQLHRSGLYARVLQALANKQNDAEAGALRRGLKARDKSAAEEGGAISLARAAKLLRISSEAVLRRARLYQLVAWRDWREEQLTYRFPAWQFRGNRVLAGIPKVLQAFRTWHQWLGQRDDWGVMLFFLASRISLGGKRPLDLLRAGQKDRVLEIALWDDAPLGELAEGLRRIEELKTGKVRGLTEADYRAQLDQRTANNQCRSRKGERARNRGRFGRSKATLTQEVLDWLNASNSTLDDHSPRQLLEQGRTEPLLQMLYELESGEPG